MYCNVKFLLIIIFVEKFSCSGVFGSKVLDDLYDECLRNEKLCYGMPNHCVNEKSCQLLLTSVPIKSDGSIEYTLTGRTIVSQWFAFGLSMSDQMSGSVTECIVNNDKVELRQSWNSFGRKNKFISLSIDGILKVDTKYADGIVICKWIRSANTIIEGNPIDILNNKYYLQLACGEMKDEKSIKYHGPLNRISSDRAVNLQSKGIVGSIGIHPLIKWHGSLMIISWAGCVSLAILLARHFKDVWPESTLCGVKLWFAFHRGLVITALTLTAISVMIIFIRIGGWSGPYAHPIIGLITIILAFIQFLSGLFRPDIGSTKRWIFNYAHFATGNVTHIFAFTAIFTSTLIPLIPNALGWVMMCFVLFYLFIHSSFYVTIYLLIKRSINKLSPISSQRIFRIFSVKDNEIEENVKKTKTMRLTKQIILRISVVSIAGFVVAMVLIISQA